MRGLLREVDSKRIFYIIIVFFHLCLDQDLCEHPRWLAHQGDVGGQEPEPFHVLHAFCLLDWEGGGETGSQGSLPFQPGSQEEVTRPSQGAQPTSSPAKLLSVSRAESDSDKNLPGWQPGSLISIFLKFISNTEILTENFSFVKRAFFIRKRFN